MQPNDSIEKHFKIKKGQKQALECLGIHTAQDLLFHFPSRYTTIADVKYIKDLEEGDRAILYGTIKKLDSKKTYRSKMTMAEGVLEDDTGKIKVVWFNQPYIAKMLKEGSQLKLDGKVQERKGKLFLSNPEFEVTSHLPEKVGDSLWGTSGEEWSLPVYPESRGVTSKWFYHSIKKLLQAGVHEEILDPLPEAIRERLRLPKVSTALVWIHAPQRIKDTLTARKRFAFEEIFLIQLKKQKDRRLVQNSPTHSISLTKSEENSLEESFPFELTNAQKSTLKTMLRDMKNRTAMSRLLEGDVGSGKTAVALMSAEAVLKNGLQTAYMAPTSVLAKQIYNSFKEHFHNKNARIAFLTSAEAFVYEAEKDVELEMEKAGVLEELEQGKIDILIGTHSLIQKKVMFKQLALAIIDEQHRFGVSQRKKLVDQDASTPHLLSMSATPIPRTLALTMYGDLDLSVLDELPPGRSYPNTRLVSPQDRESVYEEIHQKLKKGRQLYVICPRIDEPDPRKESALWAKSVKEEAKFLKQKVFKNYTIDVLHGKMSTDEKNEVMQKFANKETDILVATSVIEVGISVANATEIIIEGAERFGLSQLHQLRGRVMRSTHEPHCYLFTDSESTKTAKRLESLQKAKSGFELAEYDLQERGPGHLSGVRQSGLSDIAMEALKNIKMVEIAREEARALIEKDPTLSRHKDLKTCLKDRSQTIHFE